MEDMTLQAWAEENRCILRDGVLVSVPEDTRSLHIPEGVHTIGEFAFARQKRSYHLHPKPLGDFSAALEEVFLPESLRTIEDHGFWRCGRLRSVTVPGRVREIPDGAFESCWALEEISLPESITELGWCSFEDCRSLKSLTLPDGIREIPPMTFRSCKNLQSVDLPSGVRNIGEQAFAGCESLQSLTLPNGIRMIGNRVFLDCKALEKLSIPLSLRTLERYALSGCESLRTVKGLNLKRFEIQLRETPFGKEHYPPKGTSLPCEVTGSHSGRWLKERGYDFFSEDREYAIGAPDENGVVEVSCWSCSEDPDEEGFGSEQLYNRYLLDENLEPIPGIRPWYYCSTREMNEGEKQWDALRREAGKILRRGKA